MDEDGTRERDETRLAATGWLAIAALLGLLAWAVWYAVRSWSALGDTQISAAGWFFLVLGVIVTLGVGGGLMALLFYSSRKHYDR
jgi:hypothetical protein